MNSTSTGYYSNYKPLAYMPKLNSMHLAFQSLNIWATLSLKMVYKPNLQNTKWFGSGHSLPTLENFSLFLAWQTTTSNS